MTVLDLIEKLMQRAGLQKGGQALYQIMWFNGPKGPTVINTNQSNPVIEGTTVVAIFRGIGVWRVYVLPDDETGKVPPTLMTLTMTSPTMDKEALEMPIFEEKIVAEYRAAAGLGEPEEEGEVATCSACGAEMPPTFSHCGECGAKLPEAEEVKCGKCAEMMPAHFEFCSDCGTKLPAAPDGKPAETAPEARPS